MNRFRVFSYDPYEPRRLWASRKPARPNPYFRGRHTSSPERQRSFSRIIAVISLIAVFALTAYYFGFSNRFTVRNVSIQSSDEYLRNAINDSVKAQKKEKRFWIFPQDNLLAFSIGGLDRRLRVGDTAGYLDILQVEKVFPHTLRITASKRETGLYLVTGALVMDIGTDGRLIGLRDPITTGIYDLVATSSIRLGEHGSSSPRALFGVKVPFRVRNDPFVHSVPLVYVTKDLNGEPGTEIFTKDTTQKIRDLFAHLIQGQGIRSEVMVMASSEPESIEVQSVGGPSIYFLPSDLDASLMRLGALWLETNPKDRALIDYIDLRFADRVFVKKRSHRKSE